MDKVLARGLEEEKLAGLEIGLEEVERIPGCLLLHLTGYIDAENCHRFQKKLEMIVEAGFTRLILDMSGISFIGSTGVGGLVSLKKILREKAGDVVLQELQPRVHEVFDLLGFSRFFTTSHGSEESLAHFSKKPDRPVFPMVFACPVCAARLRAGRAGRFRCPQCRTILVLAATGAVEQGGIPMVSVWEGA